MRRLMLAGLLLIATTLAAPAQFLSPGERARPHPSPVVTLGDQSNSGQLNINQGVVTSNTPAAGTTKSGALNITGTWNAASVTFDAPLFMNITNTASATASSVLDIQIGSTSVFNIKPNDATFGATEFFFSSVGNPPAFNFGSNNRLDLIFASGIRAISLASNNVLLANGTPLGWSNSGDSTGATDTSLARRAVGVLSLQDQGSLGTATGFQVYNTVDTVSGAPTNHERGVFDWTTTANTLTIGTQAGGTGTKRAIAFSSATMTFTSGPNQVALITNNSALGLVIQNGFALGFDAAVSTGDTSLFRVAPKILGFSDNSGNTVAGWLQWAGQARLDADFSATSNTTLANVTGTTHSLTVTLQASRNYIFEVSLPMVTGATAGGIKVGFGGTATITNFIADGFCDDGTTFVGINTTRINLTTGTLAGNSTVAANTNAGTTPHCSLSGTFEVNAAGTFTVQFAQNASSATASTVKRGAYMFVNDAP